jgi:hypothetical protein
MPNESAHVEAPTFPADPLEDLRLEDAAREDAELETALGKATGTPDEGEHVADTGNGTSSKETAATSTKRAPIDKVLAALPQSNLTSDQQEAIRAVLATNTRLQQEQRGIDRRIDAAVKQAVEAALEESEPAKPADGDPMANVTADQKALFERLAKEMGFVKKNDLEQRESAKSREDYLTSAREAALKEFGDAFGAKDEEGNVVLADDVQERMTARYKPIQEHGTLTLRDLYVLTYYDDLIKAAEERGQQTGRTVAQGRKVERQRARTEDRSGIATSANIRGERGSKADSRDAVFARAAYIAKKALAGTRE